MQGDYYEVVRIPVQHRLLFSIKLYGGLTWCPGDTVDNHRSWWRGLFSPILRQLLYIFFSCCLWALLAVFFYDKLSEANICGVALHFLLLVWSFRLPATIIWSPSLDHVEISSANSRMKACPRHSFIPVLLNNIKCCAYTDPVPPPLLVGTGLYNVGMQRVEFPWNMNTCRDHLPSPVASLPEPIFLPDRFPVSNDAVPPNL